MNKKRKLSELDPRDLAAALKQFAKKVARLRSGGPPQVLDIFAGCGGISLGFQAAGFEPIAAVEIDPNAARSYVLNFHKDDEEGAQVRLSKSRNIVDYEPATVLGEWGQHGDPSDSVDVLVGGNPCQAFARVRKSQPT